MLIKKLEANEQSIEVLSPVESASEELSIESTSEEDEIGMIHQILNRQI